MAAHRYAVDLFAGCGGVSLGLKQAGWTVLAACDNDPVAAASYRANHPGTALVQGDIKSAATVQAIVDAVDGRAIDTVVICAPCQPFSARNQGRGGDPREQLIVEALAVVDRLFPRTVVFENVPGLANERFAPVLDALRIELLRLGYFFSGPGIHDAADYGVPQSRKRCIMVASRRQSVLDALDDIEVMAPRTTVRDAIGNLPPLASGERDPADTLHFARTHRPIALERLRHIPRDGGSRADLPPELWVECHRRAKDCFPDPYGRLAWDRPSPTLTTGCTDITRGRYAHPQQDRGITPREAARLQTFPDSYIFLGNGSDIARQIGNAVPPAMFRLLAEALDNALRLADDVRESAEAGEWDDCGLLVALIATRREPSFDLPSRLSPSDPPGARRESPASERKMGKRRARPRDPPAPTMPAHL